MTTTLKKHYANHVAIYLSYGITYRVVARLCLRGSLRYVEINGRTPATALSCDVRYR
jgi:hypothetical protein